MKDKACYLRAHLSSYKWNYCLPCLLKCVQSVTPLQWIISFFLNPCMLQMQFCQALWSHMSLSQLSCQPDSLSHPEPPSLIDVMQWMHPGLVQVAPVSSAIPERGRVEPVLCTWGFRGLSTIKCSNQSILERHEKLWGGKWWKLSESWNWNYQIELANWNLPVLQNSP